MSMEIVFDLAKTIDVLLLIYVLATPDEMSHQGLHCLPKYNHSMRRGSRKFCQRGSNPDNVFFFFFFFFLVRGKRIQIALKAGHHRPASETPFKWRFAGELMVAQH